jgi:hypothetical protein
MPQFQPIKRVPKAFARWARQHNELIKAVEPLSNLSAGTGILITKAAGNIVVSLRDR